MFRPIAIIVKTSMVTAVSRLGKVLKIGSLPRSPTKLGYRIAITSAAAAIAQRPQRSGARREVQ